MSQENIDLARRSSLALAETDFETWFATIAPECKLYPRPEEPGVKPCYEGWDEILEYLVNWFSGWKEYSGEPERFIDAGDYVVVDVREVGIAAQSGLRVEERFAHAVRVRDGKIDEWRMFGPLDEALAAVGG
jgi:ketosteroid isomerase-like protein